MAAVQLRTTDARYTAFRRGTDVRRWRAVRDVSDSGRLPDDSRQAMSAPTIASPGGGRASPSAQVPGFTRHTRGAIAAERDRRRMSRVRSARAHSQWTGIAHPRLEAAARGDMRRVSIAPRVRSGRRVDRGGWFDPEGAARLRIGDRAMKRCNA